MAKFIKKIFLKNKRKLPDTPFKDKGPESAHPRFNCHNEMVALRMTVSTGYTLCPMSILPHIALCGDTNIFAQTHTYTPVYTHTHSLSPTFSKTVLKHKAQPG